MRCFLSVPFQSLLLRIFFALGVFYWSLFGREPVGAGGTRAIIVLFLLYSVGIFFRERKPEDRPVRHPWSLYADIFFAGLLIFITGGANSEFHLLFYFIITLRAPFSTWIEALTVPAVCTAVYLASIFTTWDDIYWFDLVIRIGLLWFLAPLLRGMSLRSIGEREGAEKLTRELSATHDEVKRYAAALEKANARNEKRLAEITLLHRFVMEVRSARTYDEVYVALLEYARQACEAPWIFLCHVGGSDESPALPRILGQPPPAVSQWIRNSAMDTRWDGADRVREMELPGAGACTVVSLVRGGNVGPKALLLLVFPPGSVGMEEGQMDVLSALMDSVEMELELLRLQGVLQVANEGLTESNHHLMRLHELQNELSRAFLVHRNMDEIIQGIQEIMAKELFELDRLNLFMPDWKSGMLQCRTSVGIGSYPVDRIAVPMDERGGAISKAFREGKTIFFGGEAEVPEELRLEDPYSRIPAIRSRIFVIVPVLDHQGKTLGVIGADRRHTHRPIPQETVTMLEFFARHVAMVLSLQEALSPERPGP